MEHLETMEHLREGIRWMAVGQRDPLVEYRRQAQQVFLQMQLKLRHEVVKQLFHARPIDPAMLDRAVETELTKAARRSVDNADKIIQAEEFKEADFKTEKQETAQKKKVAEKRRKSRKAERQRRIAVPDATVLSFEVNFRAGEYLVKRDIWEAPHIMEHLLLGANKQIPKAREFQAELEKNGAYCNASTGTHDIIYEAECADFEWQRILEWMLVAITQPLFLEDEFIAETGNVREELTARSNNHFRHLSIALREAYGFYSVTDRERLELMSNVTLHDIKEHYKNTHTTSNMRFVIAGKITPTRKKQIRELLSSMALPKGTGRKQLPNETPV